MQPSRRNLSKATIFIVCAPCVVEETGSEWNYLIVPRDVLLVSWLYIHSVRYMAPNLRHGLLIYQLIPGFMQLRNIYICPQKKIYQRSEVCRSCQREIMICPGACKDTPGRPWYLVQPVVFVTISVNPFRTAVPFWGQTSRILSNLSPKLDCGPKSVNLVYYSGGVYGMMSCLHTRATTVCFFSRAYMLNYICNSQLSGSTII